MTQPKEVARNFLPFVPRRVDAETAEFLVSPQRSTMVMLWMHQTRPPKPPLLMQKRKVTAVTRMHMNRSNRETAKPSHSSLPSDNILNISQRKDLNFSSDRPDTYSGPSTICYHANSLGETKKGRRIIINTITKC